MIAGNSMEYVWKNEQDYVEDILLNTLDGFSSPHTSNGNSADDICELFNKIHIGETKLNKDECNLLEGILKKRSIDDIGELTNKDMSLAALECLHWSYVSWVKYINNNRI